LGSTSTNSFHRTTSMMHDPPKNSSTVNPATTYFPLGPRAFVPANKTVKTLRPAKEFQHLNPATKYFPLGPRAFVPANRTSKTLRLPLATRCLSADHQLEDGIIRPVKILGHRTNSIFRLVFIVGYCCSLVILSSWSSVSRFQQAGVPCAHCRFPVTGKILE
jgi:hypothetical protein